MRPVGGSRAGFSGFTRPPTETLTLLTAHRKRGGEAMQDAGVLAAFRAVAVQDGWAPIDALTRLAAGQPGPPPRAPGSRPFGPGLARSFHG